jgi:carbamoyl-phosphate synthase small subunit
MAGADLAAEVSTQGLRRAGGGGAALHRGGGRPRHQGDDADDDGQRGIEVHVLPATADLDGGPGDRPPTGCSSPTAPATRRRPTPGRPAAARAARRIPYFGICFGNQLLGRALGFGTYKLKYGHRGINQPVMDRTTGKVEVTAHNHGFAVDAPLDTTHRDPYGRVRVSHVCLNDDVVEGLECQGDSSRPSRCSTTRRPRPARTTRHTCSTGSDLMQASRTPDTTQGEVA